MEVLVIIGVLFLALFLIIPLIERSKMRISNEESAKIARWIWPLIMIALIVQLIMMMVRG
ncbi:hypothetical protein OPS25_05595 [Alteromonas ponticola]|uniref:Uncharacterized protein n=1 Tax=Alteromonas aquimaris TaxID=2998417 RepID=A0ABT3P5E5_9ALTE|nr:hypothetical protein [Alteromonas aquimaris]MCW8107967.1 hypothetical protein [Alteromonas aquimaris]